MTDRNDGKAYEATVFWVYTTLCKDERLTSVERDVKIPGPDGPRQIDVLVKHAHAGIEYVTIIECRDYVKRMNVTHIDAFASKIIDVNASKGVLVSRNGFSKTAVQKASRLGIGLCIVDKADVILKQLVTEIPVVVKVVHPSLEVKALMKNDNISRKVHVGAWTTINDVRLRDLVIQELHDGSIAIPEKPHIFDWEPKNLLPPFFVRDVNGEKVNVARFKVSLHLKVWYLFGHTDNFPDFVSQNQIGDAVCNIFMPDRFKMGINSSFARYERYSEIPFNRKEVITGVYIPTTENSAASFHEVLAVGTR